MSIHGPEWDGKMRVLEFTPFRETLDFFTKVFDRPVVLAGGCVRDVWIKGPDLIGDYDLWVLGVQAGEIADLDKRLEQSAHGMMEHNVHHATNPKAACIDYPERTFHAAKANLRMPCIPDDKVVQIIYTQSPSMETLLAKFDWHVCSFGFDGETVISDGASDFAAKTLTLNPENALRSARSTLRRGFHFEDKFRGTAHRLKMPNETILALAAMLTLSGNESNQTPQA